MTDPARAQLRERLQEEIGSSFDMLRAFLLLHPGGDHEAACVEAERQIREAISRLGEPEDVRCVVSELREGEDNSGSLESTDLFIEGRGISLLANVCAGEHFTYSVRVDQQTKDGGTVGSRLGEPDVRCQYCGATEQEILREGTHRKGCLLNSVKPLADASPLVRTSQLVDPDDQTRGGTLEIRDGQDLPQRSGGDSSTLTRGRNENYDVSNA